MYVCMGGDACTMRRCVVCPTWCSNPAVGACAHSLAFTDSNILQHTTTHCNAPLRLDRALCTLSCALHTLDSIHCTTCVCAMTRCNILHHTTTYCNTYAPLCVPYTPLSCYPDVRIMHISYIRASESQKKSTRARVRKRMRERKVARVWGSAKERGVGIKSDRERVCVIQLPEIPSCCESGDLWILLVRRIHHSRVQSVEFHHFLKNLVVKIDSFFNSSLSLST